ncbi:acyl-CoA dehydrogenase family protein [Streptomyces sp. BI20]|uniref:acyl-CoA dehydrogenase family protein n=1 Tax=Streptomyces sp. BI20 TaxID=3403460 RepID=UPI003C786C0A
MSPRPAQPPETPLDLIADEAAEELAASVRALLDKHCPTTRVLEHLADTEAAARAGRPTGPRDRALWQRLGQGIGALALLVPERLGGAGAGPREAAAVLTELGRAVAPVPYLTAGVLAPEILLGCLRDDPAAEPLLRRLARAETLVVPALPLTLAPGAELPTGIRADPAGRLTGTVHPVADADAADILLVLADTGLYAVAAEHARITALTSLDQTRPLHRVTLDAAPAHRLADPTGARAAVAGALLTAAGLLASEQLGVAERCLAEIVAHLRVRRQFNRPLGSFQALGHRAALLWIEIGGARAAALAAADALAKDAADAPLLVAVAQAHCSRTAVHAAEECLQLHGGLGMTWEHVTHLLLKRAKSQAATFGTPGRHLDLVAAFADLPAPPA